MTSSEVHGLAGAYALDAIDDLERRRFEEHLADCATCTDEVRGLRETTARLGVAASVIPPPDLRDRVMQEITRVRQLPPKVARPRRRRFLVLTVAAAACLVIALGAAVVLTRGGGRPDTTQRAVAAVLAAPDARTVSAPVATGGTGTVVSSRSLNRAVVEMTGLAGLPSSQIYELWLLGPQPPRPLGLMGPGAGPVLASGLGVATQLGLTVEPARGSATPTSRPIFIIHLPT